MSSVRKILSKNPYTNQVIKEFPFLSNSELTAVIDKSYNAYELNKKISHAKRSEKLRKLAEILESNVEKYAKLITIEMGKPVTAATAEIKKCANHCRYFADEGAAMIRTQRVKSDAKKSLIEYHPVGPIYHLCPFNFPFWLTFKGVIPNVLLGNPIVHRNSDSTPLCGLAIEEMMNESGFEDHEFQNIYSAPEQTELILSHKNIRGVSFTGSNRVGSIIATLAGKYHKKSVMELGGSDPFIVLDDASMDVAVGLAVTARLQNSGQVCFSGKRFIIHEQIYDQFIEKLVAKVAEVKVGDPSKPDTFMGPLAREDLLVNLERQVKTAIEQGAEVLYGGSRPEGEEFSKGNFYMPTICEVTEDNILCKEETFGPVFAVMKAKNEDEIVRLANATEYGLGCSIVSRDTDRAEALGSKIESGSVFVNEVVKSDSRLPSGGVKNSGYGRELGEHGIHEFANIKTIWVSDNHPVNVKKAVKKNVPAH